MRQTIGNVLGGHSQQRKRELTLPIVIHVHLDVFVVIAFMLDVL